MRSKRGLWNTVSYLLSDVLSIETYGFVEKYDFISDRLRAVRQELTIQRLTNTWTGCQILLSCCNFYLVSRRFFYDLKDVERAVDRPHFNEKHLHECMGSMIVFLQQLSTDELFGNELKTTREALSVLLLSSLDALHASSAIYRLIFEILADLREHGILLQPLQLTKSFVTRNWCRFARVFHRLSLIQQMTVEPFVATIRKHCFESTIVAFHNQKLPLSKFASWMLLSQAEVRELIAESSGITIDTDDVTISFNKKELSFPPDDIFNTRAAGKLSTRALIDVCQLRDTVKNVELAPLISEITQLDLEEEPKEKYSVSTNPLDIANDSDSDSDSVPIWMRKKSQKSNRENRGNRRRDSDRSANHRRDSERSERRNSDRSDQRENNREKSNGSTFHWSEGGDRRYRNSRSGKNRDRDRRSGKEGRGGRGKGKVDSTASRSWQHDDRTRTSY